MSKESIQKHYDVSRETMQDLESYVHLIIKWQKAVNLVANSTIDDIWNRHILDSSQVYFNLPKESKTIVDIGSGGGLPAVVCAILDKDNNSEKHITMIESDIKKCMFLNECIRILKLNATVVNQRIEKTNLPPFDIVTSRALASLDKLLELSKHLKTEKAIFLKGAKWEEELKDAQKSWEIECTSIPSITNEESALMDIQKYNFVSRETK